MTNIQAIILGIVEGLSEFLPISSTGHLTLISHFLGIMQNNEFILFEISIQLGAILAVIFFYFKKLLNLETIKLLIAGFIPTGIVGLLVFPYIKYLLTNEFIIVIALILGGILILIIENWRKKIESETAVKSVEIISEITFKEAFALGLAQCIAIVPGVSRSGAIIMTGLLMRIERTVLTEFTFLLAVPTMSAATLYSLYKNKDILHEIDLMNFALGFVTAFLVALLVIKFLLNYIKKNDFKIFGYYRIIFGLLLLLFLL